MMGSWVLFLAVLGFFSPVFASNDFTYTGSPVAGKPFTITWTPQDYDKIDILLFSLTGYPYYVPTTSDVVAVGIANSGTYVWNVPTTLKGYFSLSMARDFNFPVSYGPKFSLGAGYAFSTAPVVTTPASATTCTSAIPAPTEANPFLNPVRGTVFRVGIPTDIQWQPTSKNNVSLILNPRGGDASSIATATILDNIPNSGSFTWTPPDDDILDADGNYGWSLSIVDDVTQETSTSSDFNIETPSAKDEWTTPYTPLVVGQDHTFYWSHSTASTVSIIAQPAPSLNITIADKIKNTGSFTWSVPSSITPGDYEFWLVNDTTEQEMSGVFLVIGATTPGLCGPPFSYPQPSFIKSYNDHTTTNNPKPAPTNATVTNAAQSSLLAELSLLSAAARTTVIKVTPHVFTTLSPATATTSSASSSTATNGVAQFKESQSGKSGAAKSTSLPDAATANGGGRRTEIWGFSAGFLGLVVGLFDVFL